MEMLDEIPPTVGFGIETAPMDPLIQTAMENLFAEDLPPILQPPQKMPVIQDEDEKSSDDEGVPLGAKRATPSFDIPKELPESPQLAFDGRVSPPPKRKRKKQRTGELFPVYASVGVSAQVQWFLERWEGFPPEPFRQFINAHCTRVHGTCLEEELIHRIREEVGVCFVHLMRTAWQLLLLRNAETLFPTTLHAALHFHREPRDLDRLPRDRETDPIQLWEHVRARCLEYVASECTRYYVPEHARAQFPRTFRRPADRFSFSAARHVKRVTDGVGIHRNDGDVYNQCVVILEIMIVGALECFLY